jgi:PAS domain S-box-containing protein
MKILIAPPSVEQAPSAEEPTTNVADLARHRNSVAEQELKLYHLIEAAFDGILVHDLDRVIEVNRSCAAMFGYAPEEMIGMPLQKFIEPSLYKDLVARVRDGSTRYDTRGVRKDGSLFDAEVSGTAFGSKGHRVVAVRDISDRKSQEAALIEGERRYRELSETSNDLLCAHDLDGRILSVNPAVSRALDISAEELLTMTLRDLLDPHTSGLFENYLRTIERNGVAEGLMALRTRSGAKRIWHYRNTLHREGVAKPTVRGLAHDVTEREQAIHALRHSERYFRSIIENTSDMIVILDEQGEVAYHSPATERLLGCSGADVTGRQFSDLVHEEDRSAFNTLLAAPRDLRSLDIRLRHDDGSWRWFSVVASNVTNGGKVSVIVNGRDMTDRRRLEAQLEQAKRLTSLGRLTATVAHEFNNVLMGMQPFADLMQRPGVPHDVVVTGARHIAGSIARGKRVALDMLRFTRPAQPATAPVHLRDWWERLYPELQATTGNNIEITASFPDTMRVVADSVQIAQVFSNLISNARDAMPRGGKLRIVAHHPAAQETYAFGVVTKPERFAHITVEDTGTGMSEEVLRHAFDPLFTTKQNGGTGLGLAVAHQVVMRHAGYIFAESTVGVGTTFHVFLPLANATHHTEEELCDDGPVVKARRVLIVDDEPLIGEGLAEGLRDRGLESTVVDNGTAAVEAAQRFQAQVAVIDLWLPDIDGTEVGVRLRASDPDLLIVFASGHGDAADALTACAPAMFLQKPFEMRELLEAIASMERQEQR